MPYARLPHRKVLMVTGEAAEPFLQNLVTSDLVRLEEGEVRPSALLTPQGKILFDFLVSRADTGLRLDVAEAARASLLKRLTLYRLRAKVDFLPSDEAVYAIFDEPAATGGLVDRRFEHGRVERVYGSDPAAIAEAPASRFELMRIWHGVAEAETDFPTSEMFPHDVLLDQNGGVSFQKGCYVGQEVVSRMQHRGTARRRIMLLKSEGHLTRGASIHAAERPIGIVLSAVSKEGIGLVRIDRLALALSSGAVLTADGVPVEATIPPWAGYALPEAPDGAAASLEE